LDDRFSDNPLVTGDPSIRFYAGHPVYSSDGSAIGTMCIIDRKPREFSETDRAALRDLAALVETELHREQLNDTHRDLIADRDQLARKASIDGLTRLWNHETIVELLGMEVSRAARGKPLSIAMIDVDNFRSSAFVNPSRRRKSKRRRASYL
jgi:GAF domain-containing protein